MRTQFDFAYLQDWIPSSPFKKHAPDRQNRTKAQPHDFRLPPIRQIRTSVGARSPTYLALCQRNGFVPKKMSGFACTLCIQNVK